VRRAAALVLAATLLPSLTHSATAQERRFWIGIGGGAVLDTLSWPGTATWEVHREDARLEAAYAAGTGPALEVLLGYRVSRRFGLRAAFGWSKRDTRAGVSVLVPHPFFFDEPRPLEADVTDLEYRERAAYVDLQWLPLVGHFELAVFAGVSLTRVEADLGERVEFDEQFPFDDVSYRSAVTGRGTSNGTVGWSGGAALLYTFGGRWGLGLQARYTRAEVELSSPDAATTIDAGGLRTVVFLRVGF
jgi:hypothetical protein